VFDPFGDYDSRGYLRNTAGEKDLEIIKIAEHELFRAQLPIALDFLAQCKRIDYPDFLEVHRILFSALYPWSGKDRNTVLPDRSVSKGAVYFCHPKDCQRAIEEGLSFAQNKKQMAVRHLHPFIGGKILRDQWLKRISILPGLDGVNTGEDSSAQYEDPKVAASYQAFERRRRYKLADQAVSK